MVLWWMVSEKYYLSLNPGETSKPYFGGPRGHHHQEKRGTKLGLSFAPSKLRVVCWT